MTGSFETIVVDSPRPAVVRITLDRPEALNAYTPTMCRELITAVDEYGKDDALRCLVLTGAGRAFCAGADVKLLEGYGMAERRTMGHAVIMREGIHQLAMTLQRLDKPTIAAINGPAVAGGLALALYCDLRVAAETAKLGETSGNFAFLPDEGGAWQLPRIVGIDLALQMIWLSEVVDAASARELGLVTSVVPATELETATLELAERIAGRGPIAVRMAKRMVMRSLGQSLEDALSTAELAVLTINDSADAHEGVRAFFERRSPKFEGR